MLKCIFKTSAKWIKLYSYQILNAILNALEKYTLFHVERVTIEDGSVEVLETLMSTLGEFMDINPDMIKSNLERISNILNKALSNTSSIKKIFASIKTLGKVNASSNI